MVELGTKRLETDRLILRRFTIDDAKNMYNNWASDSKVNKFLSWNTHKNVDETKQIITNWINEYDKGSYNWVVELKTTGEIIGSIATINVNRRCSNAEIGYCYGSKYWNNGYASEALKKVIEYLIKDCKFHLIEADHAIENPASGKVMQKAGMHKEAILRDRTLNNETNKLIDLVVYSITEDELV